MNRRPSPRSRGVIAALCVALLLSSCSGGTSTHTSSGSGSGVNGAPGVGDPLFPKLGNGGYDVNHYSLDLDYDVAHGRLEATAEITADTRQDLAGFNLDLKGLEVTEVRVDGRKARFTRDGQELTVRPASPLKKGVRFRTTVEYGGGPTAMTDDDGSREGWVRTPDGAFVVGEPAGSMTWFPVNNHPSDKAAYDITITVPEGYTAVANGELREETTDRGRTTFRWHSAEPMAGYLATASIGKYDVTRSRTSDGLPLYIAVDPSEAEGSGPALGRLGEIVKWESERFGPYPFSSAGAIVDRPPKGIDYALETQTKPIYAGAPDELTVVHEMAHQWFGDSVTPKTWQDTWLNEGFATYAEWMWEEEKGLPGRGSEGGRSADEQFTERFENTEDDNDIWDFAPGDPGSPENVTGTPVYDRGAMVLHQLRKAVGDRTFFGILRDWPAEHRHANADSHDFIAFCRSRTDVDLDDLFDDWLYGDGRPDWHY